MLANIVLARNLNSGLGGPFFSPYDVDEVDDVTIDAILEMARGRPKMHDGLQRVDQMKSQWLKEMNYYRRDN